MDRLARNVASLLASKNPDTGTETESENHEPFPVEAFRKNLLCRMANRLPVSIVFRHSFHSSGLAVLSIAIQRAFQIKELSIVE